MLHSITVLAVLGILFVNGWTDAPNAIASAVSTRSLTMKQGVLMATVLNVLGGLFALFLGKKVAETVYFLGDFSTDSRGTAALAAAMLAVILWAVAAWRFGIPTSESHGLMAGLMGAALALGEGGVSLPALGRVAVGLVVSVGIGYLLGWVFGQWFRTARLPAAFWAWGQRISAALMAFAHGLQDTPKFASILLLTAGTGFRMNLRTALLCSLLMGLGTLLGGGRIIQTVGGKMVQLEQKEGFAADLAGFLSLFVSTLQGLPVSTTHAKTCAMMGAAEKVDRKTAGAMFLAWVLTFPACGLLAFLVTKLFLFIFI